MNNKTVNASKFTFDTEFRSSSDVMSNAARARQRKSFSQDEIDVMCAKARDAGMSAGQVRATEALAASVDALVAALRQTLTASSDEIESVRREAGKIALAAAARLAGSALESVPMGEVEAALHEALRQAIGEPRVVLRASPDVVATLEDKLDEIAREHGFEGRIHATADPTIKGADCRIEWRGGGAERCFEAIEAGIAQVVERYFSDRNTVTRMKG